MAVQGLARSGEHHLRERGCPQRACLEQESYVGTAWDLSMGLLPHVLVVQSIDLSQRTSAPSCGGRLRAQSQSLKASEQGPVSNVDAFVSLVGWAVQQLTSLYLR